MGTEIRKPIETNDHWVIRRKGTQDVYCVFGFLNTPLHSTRFDSKDKAERAARIIEPGGLGLEVVHVRITVDEIVRVAD